MIRDYQEECVCAIDSEFHNGAVSTIGVLPTGVGKTTIAAEFIRRVQPARCLFLAHRDTLVFQAKNTIERIAGVRCGIEMADLRADYSLFSKEQVIVGTVQTQNAGAGGLGRMSNFRPSDFEYLFCDEAHHWVAPSYIKVVRYFQQNTRLKVIGFTATPDRSDREALGQLFETTAYRYDILDAIDDGWLVPVEQQFVPVHGLDYSHIKTTAGDLNLGELSNVMEEEDTVQRMIQPTLEAAFNLEPHRLDFAEVSQWGGVLARHGKPARTLVFCTSINQAQRFAEVMNRVKAGIATAIWDKVSKEERRTIYEDFKSGALQVLVNVGICGEGFDNPAIELIVMGRPTKSRSLYTQFLGRALRPLESITGELNVAGSDASRRALIAASAKPTARVMDFVGNSGRHKLITALDVLGGRCSDRAAELARKKAMKSEKPVPVTALLEESEDEVKRRIERAKRLAEEKRVSLVARVKFNTVVVNPFDSLDIQPAKPKNWDSTKKLSPGQQSMMRKFGINPDDYGYSAGKQLFIELMKRLKNRLATPGQAQVLKRFGYDTRQMPYAEARKLIDALKNNNWQRPATKVEYDHQETQTQGTLHQP